MTKGFIKYISQEENKFWSSVNQWLGLRRNFSLCDLHASKHEAELVRLVMRGNIVQVQYSDLEYAVVRTEAEVGYSQNGGQLKANTLQPVIKQEKQYKD